MRRLTIGLGLIIVIGSLLLTPAHAATAASKTAAPPFRPALEAHLAAIVARDLNALVPTLTSGNELAMIAPNGFKFDTRQQYIDFHKQWFAAPDGGKLEPQIVSVTRIRAQPPIEGPHGPGEAGVREHPRCSIGKARACDRDAQG
jgi:hypothetical protein